MASISRKSDAATLALYRMALDNAASQPDISAIMADMGYDSTRIAEGKTLLAKAQEAFDKNVTEDDESSAAFADFVDKRNQLDSYYSIHRKKARVLYRKDTQTSDLLAISGNFPRTFISWFMAIRKFYTEALSNSAIQARLATLKVTLDELNAANTLISKVDEARIAYQRERGESQDATKAKDATIALLDSWMSEFYAVARIGLDDRPQLLEALGKVVR